MPSDAALEWTGALAGVLSVWLTARRKIACWPVGLVSVAAYAIFFYRLRLYADTLLQLFFFVSGVYGWWHWARGGPSLSPARIRTLDIRQRMIVVIVSAGVTFGFGSLLRHYTDASLPYWDTAASTLSVLAQCLLVRKYVDSWIVWIMVDVLSIGIYAAKAAHVTAVLYALFLILATGGLVSWRRALRRGDLV
jgi:nicotinamide mononucleotide transporter